MVKERIDHREKVEKIVDRALKEMAFFWDRAIDKLETDGVCYICNKKLELVEVNGIKKPKLMISMASGVPKGSVVFVSLCEECYNKLSEEKPDEEPSDNNEKENQTT